VTARLRRLPHAFRAVSGMPAQRLAELVRKDRIDILVDLAGHTAGNRLDVMALRPAPLQLTYLGYPNTTGLTTIDYRVTDALADPPGTTQRCTERLLRLPGCFLCYTPPDEIPPVGPLPAAARGPGEVTFVSFNALAKVSQRALEVWSRVLSALPRARLLLKAKAFESPRATADFLGRLGRLGVPADRVTCRPLVGSTHDHLAAYGEADVALDTFPYAGTTTTCEALLMGVPVVTLSGPSHAHGVGRSLAHAAGFPELHARSEDEYVTLACRLASDPDRLAALRGSLRRRMLASPLCDGRAFTRELEGAYRTVWRRLCRRAHAAAMAMATAG